MANKRFIKIHSEGMGSTRIYVDTKTGVNYLFHSEGYGGGMTVLVDRDGKPIISNLAEIEEEK